jgi:hypothetical protein
MRVRCIDLPQFGQQGRELISSTGRGVTVRNSNMFHSPSARRFSN